MRDKIGEDDGDISLEASNPVVAAVDDGDEEDETDDIVLADICEVVISLRCKQCQFLCNDKSTLANHIKQHHLRKTANETKKSRAIKLAKREQKLEKGLGGKIEPVKSGNCSESSSNSKANQDASSWDIPETEMAQDNQSPPSPKKPQEDVSSPAAPDPSLVDDPVEDVFLCAECDIVFSSREMCCSHMNKVHGLKQFSADFIQEEIISKPAEQSQDSKQGRKTKFPKQFTAEAGSIVPKKYRVTKDIFHICPKCSMKFESNEVMKFHEQCHQSSVSDMNMESIKKENGDESGTGLGNQKGFMCPVCESNGTGPQLFSKWGPCSWHLWKEHRIDCELYTCSVCTQFKSHLIARVKDHEQLHSTKASYKCKTCNKTFKQMKQLRCHEKYHKDNSTKLAPEADSRWYTPKECPICKRILSDSKCLKKHISAVHNKLKPYVCNICGHTSARKAELQLHVRQHTGEKPYRCPICPFQTGDHNSLRKHKLRHGDERPYACPYCDYRCIQSCAFKKHILACHPGQEVVFVCQVCSHASVNETLFAAHQKDHAEGRIPLETPNESETNPRSISPSTSPGSGTNGDGNSNWSGDEDSLDIIDNGGISIPASPPPETNSNPAGVEELQTKQICEAKHSPQNVTPPQPTPPPLSPEASSLKCTPVPVETMTFKPRSPSTSLKIPYKKCRKEPLSSHTILNGKVSSRRFPPPQTLSLTTNASVQFLPSPRQDRNPAFVMNNSTGTNDDTESSSSDIITNPHQLIQNIQLTPLDLTGIISCNEQSNDDGMLQRLLDKMLD